MKRINNRTRELLLELMVGAFMFAILIGLGIFTIVLSRENYLAKTFPIEVVFEDVMGLRDGDNVVIRGMSIGKVKTLELKDDGVHVSANLQREPNLREDYTVRIITTSVLGGRYLQIDEGTSTTAALPAGTLLHGEMPRDLMVLAGEVVDDIRQITAKIKDGEGTLGKLVNDDALYNDVRDIAGEIKKSLGEGGMLAKLESTVANMDEITAKINQGQGTLGKLVNEEELYNEATAMIGDARQTLDDVRETSPLVTFTTIMFGAL